jgi:hypothetical protein
MNYIVQFLVKTAVGEVRPISCRRTAVVSAKTTVILVLANSLSHRRQFDLNLVGNITYELEGLSDIQLSTAGVGRKI